MAEAVVERAGLEATLGFVVTGRANTRSEAGAPVGLERAVGHVILAEMADRSLAGGPPVTVVEWPADGSRLADLRRAGLPRLVVVGPHDHAVIPTDELEDWVRIPVGDADVRARLRRLREYARRRPPWPVLDGSGRLIFGGRWVAVSSVEERLVTLLVEHFGDPVRHDDLLTAAWRGRTDRAILRPVMSRLRRRLEPLGLDLASIRDIGYALGVHPGARQPPGS